MLFCQSVGCFEAIISIQLLLGHSDVSMTGQYIRLRPDEALKEYEDSY